MPYRILRNGLIVCSTLLVGAAWAQPPPRGGGPPALPPGAQERAQSPAPAPAAAAPPSKLDVVTARLASTMGKDFVVDPRLLRVVDLGSADTDEIDFASLISLLRVQEAVVIENEQTVYIVPEANARFYANPIVQRDDADIHPATLVTRVIVTSGDPSQMLGVLRPLAPQSAVMAVQMPNKILITDRYDNVKRITEVVRMLEQR